MTCRLMTECAEELLSLNPSQTSATMAASQVWQHSLRNFNSSKLFSRDHLWWVLHNATSVILAFWIGFFGWGPGCAAIAKTSNASCFIFPYEATVPVIVVVLLSKVVGSSFRKGLDRLIAMVV